MVFTIFLNFFPNFFHNCFCNFFLNIFHNCFSQFFAPIFAQFFAQIFAKFLFKSLQNFCTNFFKFFLQFFHRSLIWCEYFGNFYTCSCIKDKYRETAIVWLKKKTLPTSLNSKCYCALYFYQIEVCTGVFENKLFHNFGFF